MKARSDTKRHPCEICERPTDLRGWVFVMPKRWKSLSDWKKEYRWWCRPHYLTRMFNLLPFRCTDACLKNRARRADVHLSGQDGWVWLQLEACLEPTHPDRSESAMRPAAPRCPWCSKPLKPVPEVTLSHRRSREVRRSRKKRKANRDRVRRRKA